MSTTLEHDLDAMPTEASPELRRLPEDMRVWVPPDRLAYLALEAIQHSNVARLPARLTTPTGSYSIPMLATLLTYSYAVGVCGSRDVEDAIRHERTMRYLCAHHPPDGSTLRSFRRRHAAWLATCLARLLAYAWQWRGGGATPPTPDFHHEASLRLMRAIRADSMALDD